MDGIENLKKKHICNGLLRHQWVTQKTNPMKYRHDMSRNKRHTDGLCDDAFVLWQVTLENSRLKQCLDDYRARGSLLDDDSVLESIETSFQQFHAFLDMLRDAG